jgi:hypothetical protein
MGYLWKLQFDMGNAEFSRWNSSGLCNNIHIGLHVKLASYCCRYFLLKKGRQNHLKWNVACMLQNLFHLPTFGTRRHNSISIIFIVVPCILIILEFFSPTNAFFIKHIKCYNLQLKQLCIRSYMFWSNRTTLRERTLILAKVTLL